MAYLLDTNHCFLLLARDPRLADEAVARGESVIRLIIVPTGRVTSRKEIQ